MDRSSHSKPLVSIGLPVYNGENYITECVDSILSQTYENFELIISDNASTDGTEKICREYAKRDNRVQYHRNKHNAGAAWNYNFVFHSSSGKYFKWISHDDISGIELLDKCLNILEKDSSVILCYPRTIFIDENGQRMQQYHDGLNLNSPDPFIRYRDYHHRYRKLDRCNPVFGLIRTDVLKKTKLIGNYFSSDYVLLGELSLYGKFYELSEFLFFRRIHPEISTKKFSSVEERYTWFDPSLNGKLFFPYWRILRNHFRSVLTSPTSIKSKIKCLSLILNWIMINKNLLKLDLKLALKKSIRIN